MTSQNASRGWPAEPDRSTPQPAVPADRHNRSGTIGSETGGRAKGGGPARRDVRHDRRSRRYGEAAGQDGEVDGTRDVAVTTPDEPPPLTPAAAQTLLRILIKASTRGKAQP
jgi:hypothetical protein